MGINEYFSISKKCYVWFKYNLSELFYYLQNDDYVLIINGPGSFIGNN